MGIRDAMFFTFPEDASWNAERQALEFGVEIGDYRGVVRVPRRIFQRLLPERPTAVSSASRVGLPLRLVRYHFRSYHPANPLLQCEARRMVS